ncbi:hypothetical protein ACV229_00855 [Burkholderia sp. MR1-5-21]
MKIRVAGNTSVPALASIRKKGYRVEYSALAIDGDIGNCTYQYDAIKDDCFFSATTPEELLGLIAMWETRGDDWKAKDEDFAFAEKLDESMIIYDADGNIINGK